MFLLRNPIYRDKALRKASPTPHRVQERSFEWLISRIRKVSMANAIIAGNTGRNLHGRRATFNYRLSTSSANFPSEILHFYIPVNRR